jgi:hypothetical protein
MMKKLKEIISNNANKINIGTGIVVVLGFVTLSIILIKLDKEIG